MLLDPRFLWAVIVVLGLLLAAAAARLIILHLRARRQEDIWEKLTAIVCRIGLDVNKCFRLARESGRLAEFARALGLLHEASGSLATGDVRDLLKLAEQFEKELGEWIEGLAPGTFPMDAGPPLQAMAQPNGALPRSARRSRRMPELIFQPGPIKGSCLAGVVLPWHNAGLVTILLQPGQCSFNYRGHKDLRIGSNLVVNDPDTPHQLQHGKTNIDVGGHPISLRWWSKTGELHLKWPRRPRGGSTSTT
jgi:hypothetical protein